MLRPIELEVSVKLRLVVHANDVGSAKRKLIRFLPYTEASLGTMDGIEMNSGVELDEDGDIVLVEREEEE
jgi:hypothetical protein